MVERLVVRILLGGALCASLLVFFLVPTPEDARGNLDLPSAAFGQTGIYKLELSLLVFYGSLLLITPAFAGLTRGRLPTEVSTRGAKFAEEVDQPGKLAEAKSEELERVTRTLSEGLAEADLKIEQLREIAVRDSRQPEVDSKP